MEKTIPISYFKQIIAQKDAQINALQYQLDQLKKLILSSKQERFVPNEIPEQLALGFDNQYEAVQADTLTEQVTYERKKRKAHPGRTALPDNIPTEEIIIEPEEDTTDMVEIGQEVTETIDYKPGVLLKRRYIRKKYARKKEQDGKSTIVIGELPERPIPKAIAEARLLAYLFISKYVDHLPFYRQIEQFKRNYNWTIHKSTINDWFAACCTLIEPLYVVLIKKVMEAYYLQADESPIKVQDPSKSDKSKGGNGSTHQGYMWVYRNPENGLVLFDYRKGRGMQGPKEMLENFSGLLQCDGYAVYVKIVRQRKEQNIILVSCLAHIRRKFFDAKDHHPKLARHALSEIQKIYKLERAYNEENLNKEQIVARRKTEVAPILNKLIEWVNKEQANNLSKGPIGKALYYAKNHLPRLLPALENGCVQMDNNLIENAIRPLALGRKNYLFAGSHKGAERAAMMYSFFATCKTNDINPLEWLTHVLKKISTTKVNNLETLLPHNWKKEFGK